jgi:hypothetical protein
VVCRDLILTVTRITFAAKSTSGTASLLRGEHWWF